MARILEVLCEPFSNGGQEAFIMNVYSHINPSLDIDFFTPYYADNSFYIDKIVKKNNKVFTGNLDFKPGGNRLNIVKPLCHILKQGNYDVVHIHSGSIFALAVSSFAAKICKVKRIIVHSHATGTAGGLKHKLIKALSVPIFFFCPTDFFACSKAAGKWKYPKSIANRKLQIIKNGIDLDLFRIDDSKRSEYRKRFNFSDKDLVIGHVGRFAEEKNHVFIIDIFKELHKKDNKYKLLLVGDGELKESIQARVAKAGLTDSVIFTGSVNNVQDYMQAMDLFILPSLFEGLGIVGIEAQACGLPCIFSTGVPDEAKLTDNVEFVSLEDKDEWINTIERMISLPKSDNTEQIRAAGYDIKETAKKLEGIYKG